MFKVFIDGSAGTTGLRIKDRLLARKDLELIILSDELRKDDSARKKAINSSDVAILCLPDDAASAAISMVENPKVKIIDTSTAHRCSDGWIYGFPEITGKDNILNSKFIANPGCHASGFIALIYPLLSAGLLNKSLKLSCFSLTGYSGGGKKMIEEYENDKPELYNAPRQYGLNQNHKHLKEMKKVCGLDFEPCFCPIVADYPYGMEVTIPLFGDEVYGSIEQIKECYKDYYKGEIVKYCDNSECGYISSSALSGKDSMEISVFGNNDRMILVSRFDNLGKGASGAAIQNLNLLMGCKETEGLIL